MKRTALSIIEVAVVICLIALAAGGIFAAQMIASTSDARGLIAQIAKYNQAITSFKAKYNGLPGDVIDTVNFNLSDENTDGDNNRIITDNMREIAQANGEISNFWLHLSNSKMLDETYDGEKNEMVRFGKTFPISKLGELAGIIAFGIGNRNFYQVGFKFSNIDRIYMGNHSITSKDALYFDTKIDDGNPKQGEVIAVGGDVLNFLVNEGCVKNGKYNIDIKNPFCQLRIEMRN